MAAQAYQISIDWSEEDQAYLARVPKLPGCLAQGETRAQALANLEAILPDWVETPPAPPAPHHARRLLTIPEVAASLGLSAAMVRRYCSLGHLPAQKFGRDWAVRQRDLEQFAASPRRRGRKSK